MRCPGHYVCVYSYVFNCVLLLWVLYPGTFVSLHSFELTASSHSHRVFIPSCRGICAIALALLRSLTLTGSSYPLAAIPALSHWCYYASHSHRAFMPSCRGICAVALTLLRSLTLIGSSYPLAAIPALLPPCSATYSFGPHRLRYRVGFTVSLFEIRHLYFRTDFVSSLWSVCSGLPWYPRVYLDIPYDNLGISK